MTSLSFDNVPPPDLPVPDPIREAAAGRVIIPVWHNEGASTFRLGSGPDARYAKWAPVGSEVDLAGEAARMRWAGAFVLVPRVLEQAANADGTWLITAALDGEMAVTERWKQDPATAVRVIGESLRVFHDALPVAECPFSASAEERVAEAEHNAAQRAQRTLHTDFAGLGYADALKRVADLPPVDKLVVGHGDACAPNTLLSADGRFAGHVDLGDLGVADRWSDLAIATWSTTWNYGDGWEEPLLDAYGIAPDPERTEYYRLLWEVGP
ncbi:aminoglycoside 3'-phosphotransferase [Catenulispora sp. NF23]|uniref:aminoglycoside 3'-phosphotransferase n=1 Tax=Catenulispora pinistramenti TaxID=2705254 RepID=UPI001BA64870|nr:aminoglycoside 3'-phosphotransferase [Catenulispora pinistramenti]MBS2536895.1 aminoglycoside 3'-phosphotransferase [Catenulispora pinistramenti]